ncbi:hypothetical protein D5086_029019 [Populus alba]|uniref:Uncharacterized protein n=1 Tax=Populus alba TaxID=43335 RepID=A0ACC4ASA1_POPAL
MQRPLHEDFLLKETNPHLGGGKITGDKLTSTYDLVEQMQYLYASMLEVTVKDKDFVKDDFMGRVLFDLNEVPKRVPPDSPLAPQWYRLEDRKGDKVKGELMLAVWMGTQADEAFPEAWHSDAATVTGTDGLANIRSKGLMPMKTKDSRGTTDAYCVAKYGQKWVRTRTIIDSDKPGGARDSRIGKVRIRLSTLETDRVYTHSYPLLVLHPNGVKKMGEIHLAVRFTCSSLLNMMHMYSQPLLPKMHYIHPLTVSQLDNLRHQATQIVSMRLSRAEPPLRKEIVEYMLDVGSHMWSMRRSKANFFRIMNVFGGLIAVGKWFDQICNWKNPITTVLIHILFIILVLFPELILPTIFLYLFLIGVWYYRWRPRHPPHMDTRLSHAESAHPDELDEEFDTFPTSRPPDIVRMRYDRLRSIAGRIQTVVGDLATQGERLQSLLSWRDPRATALFVLFCLIAAIVLYVTPFQVVALLTGFYVLRHPRFRHKLPSVPLNFFRRLPARTDCML